MIIWDKVMQMPKNRSKSALVNVAMENWDGHVTNRVREGRKSCQIRIWKQTSYIKAWYLFALPRAKLDKECGHSWLANDISYEILVTWKSRYLLLELHLYFLVFPFKQLHLQTPFLRIIGGCKWLGRAVNVLRTDVKSGFRCILGGGTSRKLDSEHI